MNYCDGKKIWCEFSEENGECGNTDEMCIKYAEPTTTHGTTLEAEQELKELKRQIEFYEVEIRCVNAERFPEYVARCKFVLPYLKSRCEVLISQGVIR